MKFKINQKILRIGIAGFLFLSIIGASLFSISPVRATGVDDNWIGGSGDWSNNAHWSLGAPPDATENAIFNASSGSSIIVQTGGNIYCNNMDWTGAVGYPILEISNDSSCTLQISGDLIGTANLIIHCGWSSAYFTNSFIQFVTSGTSNITMNGAHFELNPAWSCTAEIDFAGTGSYILHDNFVANYGGSTIPVKLKSGNLTIDTNLYSGSYTSNSGTARSLTLTNGTINCDSWLATASNFTTSFGSSVINCIGNFQNDNLTFHNVNITGASTISGNNTFNNLNIARTAGTVQFTAGSTQTCTSFTAPISGTTNLTLKSTSLHTAWNLIQTSGTVITDYITMSDSHASGGANFYAGVHSTDVSGNTGWVFQSPPSITTSTASPVTGASANLRGTIDIFGGYSPISVSFNYATDAYYVAHSSTYSDSTVAQSFTTQAVPITVQQTVPYLLATTEYHYQMQVSWVQGGVTIYEYGADSTFVTTNYPYAETLDATGITSTTATLNGNLLSIGNFTFASGILVSFSWGTTTACGTPTTPTTATALGTFSINLTTSDGISNGQTYYYKAIVAYADASSPQFGEIIPFTVRLNGSLTITIENVGTFSSYDSTDDMLITVEAVVNKTAGAPSSTASKDFQVQFLDPTGTTVLAASPLWQWGDRPESIYLNATLVATLTEQGAYIVRIHGLWTGAPADVDYKLLPTDWYGDDYPADTTNANPLDQWCLATASNMGNTDQTLYLAAVIDVGNTINDAGTGYFETSIPSIALKHPELFGTTSKSPVFNQGSNSNSWDKSDSDPNGWKSYVGDNLYNAFSTMAEPFGVTGKDFVAGLIILGMVLCILWVASNNAGALGAVLIYIPAVWLGVWWRIIPIAPLVILTIAFGFFWIRQFVWKTT